MLNQRSDQRGVTLIELMIAIVIMGILFAVGLPSYRAWIQNTRIRNAAESMQNGLQLARAEALRQNASVTFALTTGSGWTVTMGATVIQTKSANEGTENVTVTTAPAGATAVTFTGFGRVTGATPITSIAFNTSLLSSGEARPLTVTVKPGGEVKMCDPAVGTGDSRACNLT